MYVMRINIINISPEHSAIWKVAYYLFLELKKDKVVNVSFIDLWKTKKVSHNNILRGLQLLFGINLGLSKKDINFYSTPLLSNTMMKNNSKKNIMFIHDLHPLLYLKDSLYWLCKWAYPKSRNADLLICNSTSTKKEYIKEFNCTEKIVVNHLGIDNIYFKYEKFKKNRKLTFISIGRDEPRKNLKFMLQILKSLNMDFELYRVGSFDKLNYKFIKDNNLTNKIKVFNNISEKKLIELYSKSHILLFPSTYEGFGIPPIESMACGCIPLVANKTSLPEVVMNKNMILDLNVDLWVKTIKSIYSNKSFRERLMNFSFNRAKRFSLINHKKRFLKILKNIN
jgi:glycosyltransferase involved in cell wall biosynthesis